MQKYIKNTGRTLLLSHCHTYLIVFPFANCELLVTAHFVVLLSKTADLIWLTVGRSEILSIYPGFGLASISSSSQLSFHLLVLITKPTVLQPSTFRGFYQSAHSEDS